MLFFYIQNMFAKCMCSCHNPSSESFRLSRHAGYNSAKASELIWMVLHNVLLMCNAYTFYLQSVASKRITLTFIPVILV